MSTRVCKRCGWVYPATQPGWQCRVCKEPFDEVICRTCGKLVGGKDKVPGRDQCKPCHNAQERAHMAVYTAKRDENFVRRYYEWKRRIKAIPKSYPTLTEEQWLRACRHFNGCAQCGSEEFEARGFFISFKEGGRYCDWNIIPVCERCAADLKLCPNPFRTAWQRDNQDRTFNKRESLEKIVKYLGGILDGIEKQSAGNAEGDG